MYERSPEDEALVRKYPELFQEAKEVMQLMWKDIINHPKNAHLKYLNYLD